MPTSNQPGNPVYPILAIVFLALFLAGLAARYWADSQAAVYTGPTHIAADESQVVLFAAGHLYRFSSEGELLDIISLEQAGLPGDPIDLRFSSEGNLLFASQRPARVHTCDTETWHCKPLTLPEEHSPERQFKFLMDAPGYDWIYSDARGDALWAQAEGAGGAHALLPEHTLAGPNDLAFDDQGHLWVADTDHRRVVEFIPNEDGDWEEGRSHSAYNRFLRGGNHYPMMLAPGADGHLWLTQASEFSEGTADLMVYHPDTGAVARIELPGSVFATDIVAQGDSLLVTDLDMRRVYRVDSRTREVVAFGDAAFQSAMSQLGVESRWFRRTSNVAMVLLMVFGVLMILFAIKATPKEKRWSSVPVMIDFSLADGEPPKVKGIHWLERESGYERLSKWLPRLFAAFNVLFLCGVALAFFWIQAMSGALQDSAVDDLQSKLQWVLLLVFLMVLLSIPVMALNFRTLKIRLGSDGRNLHLRLPDGRELQIQTRDLAFTHRAILYREFTVPLQTAKRRSCYRKGELETWVAPLLRDVQKLGPLQGLKYQWKHANAQLVWALVCLLGGLLLMALTLHLLS